MPQGVFGIFLIIRHTDVKGPIVLEDKCRGPEMAEQGRGTSEKAAPKPRSLVPIWSGIIVGLAVIALIALYEYGDPRPLRLDAAPSAKPMPKLVSGDWYYRLKVEVRALSQSSKPTNVVSRPWSAVFGDLVARAGRARLRAVLSGPAYPTLPRAGEDYLLVETDLGADPVHAETPYLLFQKSAHPRLRLEAVPDSNVKRSLAAQALPAIHAALGGNPFFNSGWIAIFPGGPPTAGGALGENSGVRAIRDFKGRAVGSARISLEARRSLVFDAAYVSGASTGRNEALARLLKMNTTAPARRGTLLDMIDRNVPQTYLSSDFKVRLAGHVGGLFENIEAGESNIAAAAERCRTGFGRLATQFKLTAIDAALLTYMVFFERLSDLQENGLACGDERLDAILANLGAPSPASLRPAAPPPKPVVEIKAPPRPAKPAKTSANESARPDGCREEASARVGCLCGILNKIAAEWRRSAKFLHMKVSRRYIRPKTGLEEPSEEMRFKATTYGDRRQLLIYIALAQVENFACFRLRARKPARFEALVVLRERGERSLRRVDVFEFAFGADDTIMSVRRRAALPGDIDRDMTLPAKSRCRTQFLDKAGKRLRRLVREQWRLPAKSG